jgi:hypothetical protein
MANILTKLSSLNRPRTCSPYLSLTSPITRNTLLSLKQRLDAVRNGYPPELEWPLDSTPDLTTEDTRPRAAVLVPLCNVNGQPGLLLEVRGQLRNHGGEVRYSLLLFTCFYSNVYSKTASLGARSTQ